MGAATNGGVFFAFSTFVMRALRDLEPRQGLIAMQSINRAAPNPLFMTLLFGTAFLSGGLAVVGLRNLDDPGAPGLVAGGVLYLVAVGTTIGFHVPRNEALVRLDPSDSGIGQGLARLRLGVDDGEPPPHRSPAIAAAAALLWAARAGCSGRASVPLAVQVLSRWAHRRQPRVEPPGGRRRAADPDGRRAEGHRVLPCEAAMVTRSSQRRLAAAVATRPRCTAEPAIGEGLQGRRALVAMQNGSKGTPSDGGGLVELGSALSRRRG